MLWLSGSNSSLGKCQIKYRSNWTECSRSDWRIVWATPLEDLNSSTYPKDSSRSFGRRLFLSTKLMWYIKRIVLLTKLKILDFFRTVNNDVSLFSCLLVQQYQTKENTHDIRCTKQKIVEMPFIPVYLCTIENYFLFSKQFENTTCFTYFYNNLQIIEIVA